MIPHSTTFDQETLTKMLDADPVVEQYRAFFAPLDWSGYCCPAPARGIRGHPAHPETAYIKAFLIKLVEGKVYMTQLRDFLLKHPRLLIDLGFRLELDQDQRYGFDPNKTVPSASWLRTKLHDLDQEKLRTLFQQTVQVLQQEIPGLGETVAYDVKHIYAWVKENNPRVYVKERYNPDQRRAFDPDCKLGVKRSSNQEQPDGSKKEVKEYLWGYGSGVAAATDPVYGDRVLAEYTLPFNEGDVTYYRPLFRRTVVALDQFPIHVTADAAFDYWYVYETVAHRQGIAAIPLNTHGHEEVPRDPDGTPRCSAGLRMYPTYQFQHTNGFRAQRFRCPLLFPQPHRTDLRACTIR